MKSDINNDAHPPILGPHETLENGYIISRDEQGNVTHIIDAEYSWQVAVAMVKAEEEASWPSIEE